MLPHLTKRVILRVLSRNHGSKTEVSKRASVKLATVSGWLAGMTKSANIAGHAEAVARELLAAESAAKEATGDVDGPSVRRVLTNLRSKSSSKG